MKSPFTYKKYKVSDIPADLYKKLYNLNFGEHGEMQRCLSSTRKYSDMYAGSFVIVASFLNIVVGWSLFIKSHSTFGEAHFYVRKIFRQKGIGKNLASRVQKEVKKHFSKDNIYVYPHDMKSTYFLSKMAKSNKKVTLM